jgi:hypothetical protein
LAFNAKHSALVVFPIGLLAVCWSTTSFIWKISRLAANIGQYFVGFTIITVLLNPFLWRNPITAAHESINQRQALLARQQSDFKEFFPTQVLETPSERALVLLAQTLIAPPIFAEVGNYREATLPTENEYLNTPEYVLGRDYVTAGLLLGLMVLGTLALIQDAFIGEADKRRNSIILLLSVFALTTGYILVIPLSWQRYTVPLIPFVSILAGLGITWGIKNSRRFYSHGSLISRLSQILAQFSADSRMP